MITYLKVRNLAIVEEFAIEPGAGLNVLTGETGAGKSLLIDSLDLLSGARGSTEMIRTGHDRMSAEAVFHLPAAAAATLEAAGIETGESSGEIELIVKREIAANGRGRVLINGSPQAVRELSSVMETILEIHGQSRSHARIAGQNFRELLDQYAGHQPLLDRAHATFDEWRTAADALETLTRAQRDRALRLDLLKYQIDEISAARLDPPEEGTLRNEKSVLSHAQEMTAATAGAFALLEEDDDSALAQIGRALHLLQPLTGAINDIAAVTSELQDALYRLQEVARTLGSLRDSVRDDPRRLEEVEERLVTIERLTRKYGGSVEAVLGHLASITDEHDQLTDFEANVDKLTKSEAAKFAAYQTAAEVLSASRRKAGQSFQTTIQAELNDLAMERTTVRIQLSTAADADSRLKLAGQGVAFGPEGYDRVDVLIAPNRGEEPRPMQRIASGGELSRIQLAIAAALFKNADRTAAATLVFDEIDAGIGGRVAEVIGRKLQELSRSNQVICVTHLPQIASFATTHFHVWKEDVKGHTTARIRQLESEKDRIAEIARMLGGETVAQSALQHAAELLATAQKAGRGRKRAAVSS
jgi:DNA repair protein RecN (Recombination protein N)